MAIMLDNLGLGEFFDSDESLNYLLGTVIKEGDSIKGYYDTPYIRKTFKCAEISVRLAPAEKGYEVTGFDTHCAGSMIWDVIIHSDITPDDADLGERKVLVTTCDSHGLAVVNLVNADVLPSFLDGDIIKIQVVGIPTFINFYDDEDEMSEDQPEMDFGKKVLLADGTVFPSGFLTNHDPDRGSCENSYIDDVNLIRGTIKSIYGGSFDIAGKHFEPFLKFIIDTEFGELEIDVDKEMVRGSSKETISVGMTILAGVVLSGDPAIYEYNEGKVRDEEHDLRAIRQTICKGEPERIRSILSEDCKYISCVGRWDKVGKDGVIEVFDKVSKAHEWKYVAHMATLGDPVMPGVDDDLKYKTGKRCLVLENETHDFESIMFVEYDGNGDICNIEVTNDSRYCFYIDKSTIQKSEFDFDEAITEPCENRMLVRGRYLNIIDDEDELTDEELTKESLEAVQEILESYSEESLGTEKDYHTLFRTLFGKALAIGAGYPDDSRYLKAGATFYNDYRYGNEIHDITSTEYREGMLKPLRYAYHIGLLHSNRQKETGHE